MSDASQMNDRISNVGFIGLVRMGKPMAINILGIEDS